MLIMTSPTSSMAIAPRSKGRTRTTHVLPCPTCGDVFSRADHLSRHMRSHSQERLFVCPACDKGFIRADTLGRHCRGRCFNPEATSSNAGSTNVRVIAACQRCSASKLRCDGEEPCARCHSKQVDCIYVRKSRQRARKRQLPPISENARPVIRRPEDEIFVPPDSGASSSITVDVRQAILQEPVQGEEFDALNALSQAAMQASRPLATETDRDAQPVPMDPSLQSTALSSIEPRYQHPDEAATNTLNQQQGHRYHDQIFGLLSSPGPNIIQNFERSWPADDGLNATNSNDADMGGIEDDSPGATSFGGMGYDPMLGDSFDITNWTTVDWMFLSEPSVQYDSFGQGSQMVMGAEQQLRNTLDTEDVQIGNNYGLNNVHEPLAIQQQSERSTEESHMLRNQQSGLNPDQSTRMDHTPHKAPVVVPRHDKNKENSIFRLNARKQDAEKHPEQWPTEWNPRKGDNALHFPDLRGTPEEIFEEENFAHVPPLSQNIYNEIVNSVTDISKEHSLWRPFLESSPPSLEAFNSFVQLYFEYFQPVFPMLHQPTFDTETGPWVLVLAVSAIGCRYSRIRDSAKCAIALQEFLRRAIQLSLERDNSICRRLWVAQTMVLNHLGMLYSGDRRLLELALVTKSSLTTTCRRNSCLQETQSSLSVEEGTNGRALGSLWKHWWRAESHRRVGFCAWMLDCQLPLYFDMCSAMTTDELQQNLPCGEAIWEAPDCEAWKSLFLQHGRADSAPTMQAALQGLRSNDQTSPEIGSFARLLLIHAIHQTTWVMRRQMKDPIMQSIEPIFQGGCLTALLAAANSALDVLTTPLHDGSRDTQVVLNIRAHVYHVALLIHAPLKELLAFAGAQAAATNGITEAQKVLSEWRKQDDGRTARRAVLNASILFTLIRSHPSRALHEPISLLVATLTIWAYHELSKQQTRIEGNQPTVRLDKIQNEVATTSWVMNGANLRGYVTGVGNICKVGAGKRLLQLSCKTLAEMDAWSLSQGFLNVLTRLQNGLSETDDQH